MPRNTWYHVAPRYTAGSPAMVPQLTAERVAEQETRSYQLILNNPGMLPEEYKRATELGVEGIAYTTAEVGRHMCVSDLITGCNYLVPLKLWGRETVGGPSVHWHSRSDRREFLLRPETPAHAAR